DGWIESVFATIEEGPKSLRDLVGHLRALTEGMSVCFGGVRVNEKQYLCFDCETKWPGQQSAVPLFRTSTEAGQYLSHVVLNTVAICLGLSILPREAYRLVWQSRAVVFSEFVIDEPDNTPLRDRWLQVPIRMTLDGLEMTARNVRAEIFEHAIALD